MKDEEMAEEYYYKTYPVTLNIGEEERKKEVTDIFLAGLKAGRPQWHDLRKDPNDLPKRDMRFSTHISIPVLTQTSGFAFYQFDDKKWYFQGKEIDVIAWCEIPTFDKE